MNLWLLATLGYLGAAAFTFVPVASALLRRIQLHDGGDGPDESPLFLWKRVNAGGGEELR